ncbi:uncharacterized protein Nmag_2670 [Natrialba magadii ATCC 43099]|uniref:Uncharacterized protein n=1 Tax=Natrialba magadii (strain ATCC 43099 / DSM 3394 / CCM 3739 / CIP 104546 / IAM 13178 / JCM 8861 / NBRC 102185 / NCIMB 2190 / MS3) TaxID=547559 RepID=D3SZ36_NATMM|nr:hypothetical protein [Natrialba magadii]ADD06228.1 uncharacterized protein Nmag_2670 [Natrialba magadii ATCC 43099]ELY31057.1 hypothetical protein C500_07031 [Natrialba magadii ATCC 43099]
MTGQTRDAIARWALLTGNRLQVAVVTLAVLALVIGFAGVGVVRENQSPLYYLLSSLVAGNITLITVVVSINQLVISRDFGTPAELQREIRETLAFHHRATNGSSASLSPAGFLRAAVADLDATLADLGTGVPANTPFQESLLSVRERLQTHTDRVSARLGTDDDSLRTVVLAIYPVRYLDYVQEIYSIQAAHTAPSPAETDDRLAKTVVALESLDIARYYFLSMYIQQELSRLSRLLVYAGLPAIALAGGSLIHLSGYDGGATLSSLSVSIVTGTILVGLFPIALLAAAVLRISTIAQSISITPFDPD